MTHPKVLKASLIEDLWTLSGRIYAFEGMQTLLLDWQDLYQGHVNGVLFAMWSDIRGIKLPSNAWPHIHKCLDTSHANDVAPMRALRKATLKSDNDAYQHALHAELEAEKRQQSLLIETMFTWYDSDVLILDKLDLTDEISIVLKEQFQAYMTHHIDTCLSSINLKDAAFAHTDKITSLLNENA